MTLRELRLALELAGLESLEPKMEELLRLATPLSVRSAPDASIPIGATKIGGLPDLPEGLAWPQAGEKPLAFLWQIRLSDLPANVHDGLLPDSGLLSFFYDADEQPWGYDPKDAGSSRLLFLPEDGLIRATTFPDDLPNHCCFHACRLLPEPARTTLPDPYHPFLRDLLGENMEVFLSALEQVTLAIGEKRVIREAGHQLLGWASPVQGSDMELECQLASNGVYVGNPSGYNDERRAELEAGVRDWRLLFQIDSDDDAGWMWGDCGMLYVWIRTDDLIARRFDHHWVVLQCS